MEKGGPMANTHSHLTLSDRIYIEQALERRMKFKDIAVFIGKDPTTVSKEIRRHRVVKESGLKAALCENRSICIKQHLCCQSYCNKLCSKYTLHYCHSYSEDCSVPIPTPIGDWPGGVGADGRHAAPHDGGGRRHRGTEGP